MNPETWSNTCDVIIMQRWSGGISQFCLCRGTIFETKSSLGGHMVLLAYKKIWVWKLSEPNQIRPFYSCVLSCPAFDLE